MRNSTKFCRVPCQGAERLAARGCERAMRSIDGVKRNLSAPAAVAADVRLSWQCSGVSGEMEVGYLISRSSFQSVVKRREQCSRRMPSE